jgi:hypothetical protein
MSFLILASFEAQAKSSSKPHYAIHLVGSLSPLGGTPDVPGATLDQTRAYAVSLGLEYQPEFLQTFGVVSFGPVVDGYFFSGKPAVVESSKVGLYGLGGTIKYQGYWMDRQILVPYFGYQLSSYKYSFIDGSSGRMMSGGIFGGVMFLLNVLAPQEAFEGMQSSGLTRSYLTFELKNLTGTSEHMTMGGMQIYFGLRLETL